MKLTILERLLAMNLLPEEGNVTTMRMRMKLIEKLGLSAEELEKYELGPGEIEGTVKWRQDLPQDTELEFKTAEITAIQGNLEELNKADKLTPNHLSLYDKFVDDEED